MTSKELEKRAPVMAENTRTKSSEAFVKQSPGPPSLLLTLCLWCAVSVPVCTSPRVPGVGALCSVRCLAKGALLVSGACRVPCRCLLRVPAVLVVQAALVATDPSSRMACSPHCLSLHGRIGLRRVVSEFVTSSQTMSSSEITTEDGI
jgi:hypothetical protein